MKNVLLLCCFAVCGWAQTAAKTPLQTAMEVIDQGRFEGNILKRKQFLISISAAGPNAKVIEIVETELATAKTPEVRQAAAAALGEAKSTGSIGKLQKAMAEDEADVAFTAARSLWQLGDRTGREFFEQALLGERGDNPGLIKGGMRDARAKMANPKGLALMGVKEGLGMLFGPAAMGVTVYQELQKDAGATARTLAASLLAKDTDPSSVAVLEEGLSDKNWIVRAACAKGLAERASIGSVVKLAYLLDDKADGSRYTAAAAIVRLEDLKKAGY